MTEAERVANMVSMSIPNNPDSWDTPIKRVYRENGQMVVEMIEPGEFYIMPKPE